MSQTCYVVEKVRWKEEPYISSNYMRRAFSDYDKAKEFVERDAEKENPDIQMRWDMKWDGTPKYSGHMSVFEGVTDVGLTYFLHNVTLD